MEDDNSIKNWHSKSIKDILKLLGTSGNGLSHIEVENRIKEFGYNELVQKKSRTIFQLIYSELTDPMILILLVAAILSLALGELIESFVILFIVFVNTVISIVQEKKAETSIQALKSMGTASTRVIRENEEELIPSRELVKGDIVILEAGNMVPADIRIIEEFNLKVQEAALTGESIPIEKDGNVVLNDECNLGDRINMLYTSSLITYGRAVGVVTETGMNTEVGHIASMLNEEDDFDTPMKQKLASVGKSLTIVGIIVCVIIFIIGLMYKRPLLPLLMTSISLAISIIPEGLPATATIVMALGVKRMVKENALVRKLSAVETLGGASVICSDKTGTLTQNKMVVTCIAAYDEFQNKKLQLVDNIDKTQISKYQDLIYCGSLCNDASVAPDDSSCILGDPTEGALILLASNFGIDHEKLEELYPREFEQPFDSDRKRMTTVHKIDDRVIAYTKGAIDELLPLCTMISTTNGNRKITYEDKNIIINLCTSMSNEALRVLGFAKKELDVIPKDGENIENNLVFIGVMGMVDPPREEVFDAINTCRGAGIKTIMITGDHVLTAKSIAGQLGILEQGENYISGEQLDKLSDDELDKLVMNTTVFARVSPSHKLKIVKSLKRVGEIVAMTGDGVNDAPALKGADIGVSMGVNGTDVAKDASDMILLDDDFTTIIYAVKEGRRVYRNIQKVIQFLLAGNIAEILTLFIATLFNWDPPILAVHILCINLATDSLPALALGVDPASKNIMKQKPLKSGSLFEKSLVTRVILHGIFITISTILAFKIGIYIGNYSVGQTMAFSVLALSQMLHAFNQRSNTDSIFTKGNGHNVYLIGALLISLMIVIIILFVPFIRDIFSLTILTSRQWLFVLLLSVLPVIFVEITKFFKRLTGIED